MSLCAPIMHLAQKNHARRSFPSVIFIITWLPLLNDLRNLFTRPTDEVRSTITALHEWTARSDHDITG
jgi:hypothetical protein